MDLMDPEFHKHALAHSRAMQLEITGLLDDAVTAGELQKCDTTRLARAVEAIIGGSMLKWAVDREGKVTDRMTEDLDSLLRPGRYLPRERRRHPRRTTRKK
jgi:hypothetical protein